MSSLSSTTSLPRIEPDPNVEPPRPGEHLKRDILPMIDMPRGEIAQRLGVSRMTLSTVLRGGRMTPEMCERVGALTGEGSRIWMAMQARHDLWEARRRLGSELDRIEPAFK